MLRCLLKTPPTTPTQILSEASSSSDVPGGVSMMRASSSPQVTSVKNCLMRPFLTSMEWQKGLVSQCPIWLDARNQVGTLFDVGYSLAPFFACIFRLEMLEILELLGFELFFVSEKSLRGIWNHIPRHNVRAPKMFTTCQAASNYIHQHKPRIQ